MKKIFIFTVIILSNLINVNAATMTGGVSKVDIGTSNQVIDSNTNMPINNAKITLPKYNITTYSDSNGNFQLGAIKNGATILSVEKEGYRPFSLTITDKMAAKPLVLGIQKSNITDIVIESDMIHLGDDNYAVTSANAGNFRLRSSGPYYSKNFIMKSNTLQHNNYLVIGSILGIDSLMAKKMGQNKIVNSYASPPEVYFNGTKIADIQLNGDNQKIKLPNNLIKPEKVNEVTIKTGKNLMQRAYVDYDDIELANLSIMTD